MPPENLFLANCSCIQLLDDFSDVLCIQTTEGHVNQARRDLSRIRYVTQANTRPPTFVAFLSGTSDYPQASLKLIENLLRAEYGFDGVPLRIDIRIRETDKKSKKPTRRKSSVRKLPPHKQVFKTAKNRIQ